MPATSPRILLVEDDYLFRELLALALCRFRPHVHVLEAVNGHDAYTRYQQDGADLIITDDRMPLLRGIDLIRAVRAHAHTTPVLLLSSDPCSHAAVADDPYTHFASKPVLLEQILQAVDMLLSLV